MPALQRINVRISDLRQLFNSFDPAPFHQKDLDSDAEEYIVGSADEFPPGAALELVIHLPPEQLIEARETDVQQAIHNYFAYRADDSRRRIRFLFREGRSALAIGLAFLFVCIVLRQFTLPIPAVALREILQEGLIILGWVAMWRPLQIFLYDWWPIRHRGRLYRKLASVPVTLSPFGAGD